MKVSELVKILLELDPKDEAEICINNHPVSFADRMPWYWDGRLEFVERDKTYTPIKAGYKNTGSKIKIHYDTLEDALMDNPDVELDLSGITYQGKIEERYKERIEEFKRDGHEYQKWKKENIVDAEGGKRILTAPQVSLRTRFTRFLRSIKLIDPH